MPSQHLPRRFSTLVNFSNSQSNPTKFFFIQVYPKNENSEFHLISKEIKREENCMYLLKSGGLPFVEVSKNENL